MSLDNIRLMCAHKLTVIQSLQSFTHVSNTRSVEKVFNAVVECDTSLCRSAISRQVVMSCRVTAATVRSLQVDYPEPDTSLMNC